MVLLVIWILLTIGSGVMIGLSYAGKITIPGLTPLLKDPKTGKVVSSSILGFFLLILIVFIFPLATAKPDEQPETKYISTEKKNTDTKKQPTEQKETQDNQKTNQNVRKIEDKLKKKEPAEVNEEMGVTPLTDDEKRQVSMAIDAPEDNLAASISSDPSKRYFNAEVKLMPLESYKEQQDYMAGQVERQMSYGKGLWKNEMCYFVKEYSDEYGTGRIKIYPSDIVTVRVFPISDIQPTLIKYYELIQTGMKNDQPEFMKKLIRIQLNVPEDTKIIDMDLENGKVKDTNNTKTKIQEKEKTEEETTIKGQENYN